MILAHLGGKSPQQHKALLEPCSTDRSPFVHPAEPLGANPQPTAAAQLAQGLGVWL
jgi:hypothetical protein